MLPAAEPEPTLAAEAPEPEPALAAEDEIARAATT